jgi:hypothetical protein
VGGIAVVSWILMPFYYLPVLVALITTAVLASLYVRSHYQWKWPVVDEADVSSTGETHVYNMYTVPDPGSNNTSTIVELPGNFTESTEGYLKVTPRIKQSKRGITFIFNRNSLFKTNAQSNNSQL